MQSLNGLILKATWENSSTDVFEVFAIDYVQPARWTWSLQSHMILIWVKTFAQKDKYKDEITAKIKCDNKCFPLTHIPHFPQPQQPSLTFTVVAKHKELVVVCQNPNIACVLSWWGRGNNLCSRSRQAELVGWPGWWYNHCSHRCHIQVAC